MRTLKLQMQITADGFVAGPEGQLDWMAPLEADHAILALINRLTDTSDTILMGRKMAPGFLGYWEAVKPDSPEYSFAQKMIDIPKIVFSKTLKSIDGKNVRVENGDLAETVKRLKGQAGKDIMVYGGATFVGSLIEKGLIDQMNLFVNPVAVGRGMQIFKGRHPLELAESKAYPSGVVVNRYEPT